MSFRVAASSAAVLAFLYLSTSVHACDLHALHNSKYARKPVAGTFHLGVSQQFTGYDELRERGRKADNPLQQHMESSITQLFGGYDLTDDLSLQVALPYINRRFARAVDGERQKGTEAGIGDMTISAGYVPFKVDSSDLTLIPQFFIGVKLPTGDSDRLKEEQGEHHSKHAGHHHEEEEMVAAAVHGHDLALGSGSTDVPFGFTLYAESGRWLFNGGFQYSIRTGGDHGYQYADDIMFSAAPGYSVVHGNDLKVALSANLTGENKAKDSGPGGEVLSDTALAALYIGPKINADFGRALSATLGVSWPLYFDTSELQVAAKYRLNASANWAF